MAAACTGNMLSSVFEPVLFFGCYFRFLIRLSHASYCMTRLFIRSSYTQRLLHTYIEEFGERLYSVCTQVS